MTLSKSTFTLLGLFALSICLNATRLDAQSSAPAQTPSPCCGLSYVVAGNQDSATTKRQDPCDSCTVYNIGGRWMILEDCNEGCYCPLPGSAGFVQPENDLVPCYAETKLFNTTLFIELNTETDAPEGPRKKGPGTRFRIDQPDSGVPVPFKSNAGRWEITAVWHREFKNQETYLHETGPVPPRSKKKEEDKKGNQVTLRYGTEKVKCSLSLVPGQSGSVLIGKYVVTIIRTDAP